MQRVKIKYLSLKIVITGFLVSLCYNYQMSNINEKIKIIKKIYRCIGGNVDGHY